MTTANVVFSGPADVVKPTYQEAQVASGQTILPGHLVLKNSGGEWINHNVDGQGGAYRIADINIIEQKGVTDALTVGQDSGAFWPRTGETYNIIVADGETVVVDSPLTSNGDGTCKVAATDGTEEVLFYAEEAASPSGSTARVRARVATAGYNADSGA